MASLVLKMSVSLDGYVAPLDGETDWAAAGRSEDGAAWTLETVSNATAHLMGAATYASWANFWPGAPGPFAEPMNEIPKVVFSNSLTSADWPETTIGTGDLAEAVDATQAGAPRRVSARPRRRAVRPIAGRDGFDRRVPPRRAPGDPRRGGATLHRAAHDRTDQHDRLQPRCRRPRLHRAPVIAQILRNRERSRE